MYGGTATHTTLLARLSAGEDAAAWSEFVERYGQLIRGFCARRGLRGADADDVQQDVLLALSRAMPGFRYDPGKGLFRSYLKTVVMNAISRRLRQDHGAARLSDVGQSQAGAPEDDDQHWELEWRQYHLRLAMRTIDAEFRESDRSAFGMYAIEGREARDVAAELGMSLDAVYQAKSRILRRLGTIIESQVAEEG